MIENSPSAATSTNDNLVVRKKWIVRLAVLFVTIAISYLVYWFITSRHSEYCDDAYVTANIIQITPQVAGTVVSVAVNETDFVRAGDVLVTLDKANQEVALQEAEARLAQTVREVRTLYTAARGLTAAVSQHRAELQQAQADMVKAQADFVRRQPLAVTGAVSGEELQHAKTALEIAQKHVLAMTEGMKNAGEQLQGNLALTSNLTIRSHPKVLAAASEVKLAYLNLKRSEIISPIEGYVGKRNVQLGQRVAIGTPLLTIVPLKEVWVDANYKEAQLRRIRIGQTVSLTADIYGTKVSYDAHVIGIGSGTGSAFALLPAQNATGNWIKVVQRVPVRIAFDPSEVAAHPLRVGMSMESTVDTSSSGTRVLSDVTTPSNATETNLYNTHEKASDILIQNIIIQNVGDKLTPKAHQ